MEKKIKRLAKIDKISDNTLTLSQIALVSMCLQYKSSKTQWEKETVISSLLENFLSYSSNLKVSSAKSLSLEESKICYLGKG